ncbi:MAG: peptidoglycan bridge formation glycyltransferase FemA/FemB family protein [Anaerolineae bacterium]|nr:peptidoglycan bridge formation glycyltransferase FemA/FemB family protein [Anaerolineae bacterium]
MLNISTITDRARWNDLLRVLPYAHILQSWEWGEFKRVTTGWLPSRLAFERDGQIVAMASVGVRSVGPLKVMYVPKGPALAYDDPALLNAVLDHLQAMARRGGAVWLKFDPDVLAGVGVTGEPDAVDDPTGQAVRQNLQGRGWRFSADQVQFRNTITLDLTRSEDDLLAAMSQNTRRKVRTAEKKGVTVRSGTTADLPLLYDLYQTTGTRDHFLIRPREYYERAWRDFMEAGLAHALIAEFEGKAIAHVILLHFARTCWYFYGASANEERERMPNYLLQWEAMRWAKGQGYAVYDMWGAPDTFDESDSMWGVFEFKRGFRGVVRRHIGAWDYAPYPPLYWGYTQAWPRLLKWLRRGV